MKKTLISLALLVCIPAGGWLLWRNAVPSAPHPGARKVLFYQDSMHPWIKADTPGKCTVCGMDLTPIYEGQQGFGGDDVVVLSSNNITVLNVQTEEITRQSLRRTLRVAGTLDANEAKKTIISAPTPGRIEDTAVDYPGVEVHKGERLVTFYSPELTSQKYRYLVRAQRSSDQHDPTGGLASQKGDADPYYTDLVAPLGGTVIERNVSRGQYVSEGERLFTIADASVLWFRFAVYEQQMPWLHIGQKVMVSLPAVPGEVFEAVVSFIDPVLDPATRTVKVRADLANPLIDVDGTKQRRFKFGLYAEGVVRAEVPNVLTVPLAALLTPGKASYAYVDKGGSAFERRRLKLGQRGDDLCEVLGGLEEGEQVVTSGNVLLDAQAQLNRKDNAAGDDHDAAESMATQMPAGAVPPPAAPVAAARQPPFEAPVVPHPPKARVMSMPGRPASVPPPPPETAMKMAPAAAPQLVDATPTPVHVDTSILSTTGRRGLARSPAGAPDTIPYGGRRMMEGPMFVRMAELRNAEMTEQREAKAAAAAGTNVPVAETAAVPHPTR